MPTSNAPVVLPTDGGPIVACKNLALYQQYVLPLFAKKYENAATPPTEPSSCFDCHADGAKGMAVSALFLSMDPMDADGCLFVLAMGAKDGKLETAGILTSSDPSRLDGEPGKHDFKFKTQAEFAHFKEEVTKWLATEL